MTKRFFTLIVLFALALTNVCAQGQEHMKFMGIPLNGTINQFQTKLGTKGISVDVATNKSIGVGCRAFKGSFSGKDAQIFIYYDESSKVVYRAKAVIQSSDEDICDNNYNYFVNMLSTKYSDAEMERGEQDGHESISFFIPNDELTVYKYLGTIDVYRSNYYSISYSIHVDYTDTLNKVKHENRNMDDL